MSKRKPLLTGQVISLDHIARYFEFIKPTVEPQFNKVSVIFSARKNKESGKRATKIAVLLEKPRINNIPQMDKPYFIQAISSPENLVPESSDKFQDLASIIYKNLTNIIQYQPVYVEISPRHIWYDYNFNLNKISLDGFLLNLVKSIDESYKRDLRPDFGIVAESRIENLFRDRKTPPPRKFLEEFQLSSLMPEEIYKEVPTTLAKTRRIHLNDLISELMYDIKQRKSTSTINLIKNLYQKVILYLKIKIEENLNK